MRRRMLPDDKGKYHDRTFNIRNVHSGCAQTIKFDTKQLSLTQQQ